MTLNWNLVGFVKRSKNRQKVLELLEKPLTPSDVAQKLKISLTHASKVIRELNSKGLIECLNEKATMGRIYKRTKEAEDILESLKES